MATYTDNYNLIKPSYSEIADVATINTNMNTIDDIMHSSQVSLAPAYDSTQTYNTGDVVMYELLMYKCTDNNVTGTWDASKWERTTASECGDSGSGGTSVVPNPQGEPTDTLETIEIDGTVYDIAGSGGGGSARKLYKKLYNGNITSTGEVILLESIENYDFIMIELAYLSGEGNPVCGSTIADVPYLKSAYNNKTSIWVDGGNNDRSAKIAFSNATTMKVNKASAADAIIGVYGFKLEASGGGGGGSTITYGYGGAPSFNGNNGDVHIVLDLFNKKKGEFMWLNNQWTLIEGSGEVALKVYDNGVEGVAWSVIGGTKNTTNISLTVGGGTFTNYAITDSAVNVTNYSTLTVTCRYRDQNYTKVIDLTNESGNKYISFLYVTDSNHNECAVGLTDTNSPAPTYRVDSRDGGTAECIMYSCTLE